MLVLVVCLSLFSICWRFVIWIIFVFVFLGVLFGKYEELLVKFLKKNKKEKRKDFRN